MAASLSDYQNLIGWQGLVGQNPYLQYQGQIPMAGFYTGQGGNMPPTDASGRPIQSFVDYNNNAQAAYQQQLAAFNQQQARAQTPGTTLNSAANNYGMSPEVYQGLVSEGIQQSQMPSAGIGAQIAQGQGMPMGIQQLYARNFAFPTQGAPPQQAAAPAAPQAPSPPDLRQAYLDALANPGKVNTPGAQMYPGAQPTGVPQPSVLQQFLAKNQAGTGAGGYTNQPFFQTLNALQAQKPGAGT